VIWAGGWSGPTCFLGGDAGSTDRLLCFESSHFLLCRFPRETRRKVSTEKSLQAAFRLCVLVGISCIDGGGAGPTSLACHSLRNALFWAAERLICSWPARPFAIVFLYFAPAAFNISMSRFDASVLTTGVSLPETGVLTLIGETTRPCPPLCPTDPWGCGDMDAESLPGEVGRPGSASGVCLCISAVLAPLVEQRPELIVPAVPILCCCCCFGSDPVFVKGIFETRVESPTISKADMGSLRLGFALLWG